MNDTTLDDLAALDAIGALDVAEAAELLRRVTTDPAAAAVAAEYREAAATIAGSLEPVVPPAALRETILAAAFAAPGSGQRVVRHDEGRWRDIGRGIRMKKLGSNRSRNTVTLLFRAEPGASYADHDHRGSEDTFVISGSCRIGEALLQAGDFLHVNAGTRHGEVSTEEGCLLLIVADYADFAAA